MSWYELVQAAGREGEQPGLQRQHACCKYKGGLTLFMLFGPPKTFGQI